jgi:hypothetical protein
VLPVSRVNFGVPVTTTLSEKLTWIEITSPALYVAFVVEELMLVIVGDVVSGPVFAATLRAVELAAFAPLLEYVATTLTLTDFPTSASVSTYVFGPGKSAQVEPVNLCHV